MGPPTYLRVCQAYFQAWLEAYFNERNSQISNVPWMSISKNSAEFSKMPLLQLFELNIRMEASIKKQSIKRVEPKLKLQILLKALQRQREEILIQNHPEGQDKNLH